MDLKKHCRPGADSDSGAAAVLALVEWQLARVLAFLASVPTGAAGRSGGVLASSASKPATASASDRSWPRAWGARGGGQDCATAPMMSAGWALAIGSPTPGANVISTTVRGFEPGRHPGIGQQNRREHASVSGQPVMQQHTPHFRRRLGQLEVEGRRAWWRRRSRPAGSGAVVIDNRILGWTVLEPGVDGK